MVLVPRLASPAPRTQYLVDLPPPPVVSPHLWGLLQEGSESGSSCRRALAGQHSATGFEVSIARRRDPWKALSGRLEYSRLKPCPRATPHRLLTHLPPGLTTPGSSSCSSWGFLWLRLQCCSGQGRLCSGSHTEPACAQGGLYLAAKLPPFSQLSGLTT